MRRPLGFAKPIWRSISRCHDTHVPRERMMNVQRRKCLLWVCAVVRRRSSVGANPTRQLSLRPGATGAIMDATKWLKPSESVSRIGEPRLPLWVKSGSPAWASECPVLGVKQTSYSGGCMSPCSQERTFVGILDVPDRGIGWLRKERRSPGSGAMVQFPRV